MLKMDESLQGDNWLHIQGKHVFEYLFPHVSSAMLSSHSHIITATLRNKYCFLYFRDPETEARNNGMTSPCHSAFKGQRQNYKTGLDFNLSRRINFDH